MNVPPEIIYGAFAALFGLLAESYRRCARERSVLVRALMEKTKNDRDAK